MQRLLKLGALSAALVLAITSARPTTAAAQPLAAEAVELVSSLVRLGEALIAAGDLEDAATVLTEADALVRTAAPGSEAQGRVLNRLAAIRRAQGEVAAAASLYADALAVLEPVTSPGNAERDLALNGLSDAAYRMRDLSLAATIGRQLVDERTATLDENDAALGSPLHLLGKISAAAGDLETAETWFYKAIQVLEDSWGADSAEVGYVLSDMAVLARRKGNYLEARRLIERCLVIFGLAFGPQHPYMAGMLNNLGGLLTEMGDLEAARLALERALEIREKAGGSDSTEVAQILSNLGAVAIHEGDSVRAVPLLERALAIRERRLGAESREVGLTLVNLGYALDDSYEAGLALPVLERSISILERYPGDSVSLGNALNNLGLVLIKQGRGAEAAAALDRARVLYEDNRGHDHPRTAMVIFSQAKVAAFRGETGLALGLALEAVRITSEHLRLTAAGLSEREALEYAGAEAEMLDLALSLVAEPELDDPTMVAAVWDGVIRSRGVVLDEMADRRIVAAEAPDVAPLVSALRSAAGHLSRHLVEGRGLASDEEIRAARLELELAERALGESSPAYARGQERAGLGLEEVVSSLPTDAALVAYTRFARRATQDWANRFEPAAPWYLAFVRAPTGELAALPLAAASVVDPLVVTWRSAAGRPTGGDDGARAAGAALRAAIWDPVSAVTGDATRVVLVPDGELGLLNFAALPVGEHTYLVETGPLLATIGQERDLVRDPLKNESSPCLLAVGDPDFDAAPGGLADRVGSTSDSGPTTDPGTPVGLAGVRFSKLPGTATETEAVATLWTEAGAEFEVVRLTGSEASEAAFKALAPGFRALHLATHGFSLGKDPRPAAGFGRGVSGLVAASDPTPGIATPSSLQVSGLALAGSNNRETTAGEGDGAAADKDGILTAEEIAVLDLSSVEWAVLSACDSGVGEAIAREGVFGLRRAFRIAGAETVIMSLWPVGDEAAREWMTALYRARLVAGLGVAEAVRQASLDVLAARRSRGASVHPSSWAAFVASGDGR